MADDLTSQPFYHLLILLRSMYEFAVSFCQNNDRDDSSTTLVVDDCEAINHNVALT